MSEIISLPAASPRHHIDVVRNYEYIKMVPIWQQLEDCYNGDVKRFSHRYISPPAGTFDDKIVNNDAIQQTIQSLEIPVAEGSDWSAAAKSYALGGFEPDLIPKTLKGFKALAGEHAPVIELSPSLEYLIENCTKDGKSLNDFYLSVLHNVLLKGRDPILVDIDEADGKLKFVEYKAEALQYWRTKSAGLNLNFFQTAILKDVIPNPDFDPIDNSRQENEFYDIYFKLSADDNIYTVTTYYEDPDLADKIVSVPSYKGRNIDFIPLVAIGSLDNTPNVDAVPLVGIANCVIQIYSLGCVLAHSEFTSSVPTMYITGVNVDDAPNISGAGVLYCLPEYTSKVGYTETDTSAMQHIRSRMDDFYLQAQELGASLLGSSRQGTESGEALRLRQASSTATLKSIVTNVGIGITRLLNMIAEWHGITEKQIFVPNREFSTFALTSNETIALVQTWQSGLISRSTALENLRKAGMLPAGSTVQDEKDRADDMDEQYFEKCGCTNGGTAGPSGPNVPSAEAKLDVGRNLQKTNLFDKKI